MSSTCMPARTSIWCRCSAYVVPRFGADGFLLGSNYIWGWETNRVARDLIADAGGKVLGERYLPLGETDVSRLIAEIEATRPDFVLNNLIGPSSYAFIAAYAALAARDPHFRPERCPILSCNLTECELPAHRRCRQRPSFGRAVFSRCRRGRSSRRPRRPLPASSFEAAAYASVQRARRNPGRAIPRRAGPTCPRPLPARRSGRRSATSPSTRRPSTPPCRCRSARIEGAAFRTVSRSEGVAPDPYLSRYDRAETFGRPRLKVVS